MSFVYTLAFVLFSFVAPGEAAEEEQAIRRAVLEPLLAGVERKDLKAYMAQWTGDARLIVGRGPMGDGLDVFLSRKQIEDTRRVWFSFPPTKLTILSSKCQVFGDQAIFVVERVARHDRGADTMHEVYRLRKGSDGWKVTEMRYWVLRLEWPGGAIDYTDKHFAEQEKRLRKARNDGNLREELNALVSARRLADAYRAARALTTEQNVTADDWAERGYCALRVGEVADALASFRQAHALDKNADVPELVKTARSEP